jgi:hypothetical protein
MKQKNAMIKLASDEHVVVSKIYLIRGYKVMLDYDLAEMYGVETRRLNEQVKRNPDRFPKDFMFQLRKREFENLMSQNAISSWGGRRSMPLAFTEHGVLMLSGILNSTTAIKVNIKIMRVYTKLREMLSTHKDILLKMEDIEKKMSAQETKNQKYDTDLQMVFNALKRLMEQPHTPRKRIGFKTD